MYSVYQVHEVTPEVGRRCQIPLELKISHYVGTSNQIQEQQILLTTEPPLNPPVYKCLYCISWLTDSYKVKLQTIIPQWDF